MPPSPPKSRQRTLHGIDHDATRFRPETVDQQQRPRLTAKIGEFCIARQMDRLESQDRER